MKKCIYIQIVLISIISIMSGGYASAQSESKNLYASARVLPYANYNIAHQNSSFTLTSADINKGYIDVESGMSLSIKTNSKDGYLLIFAVDNSLISKVTVYNHNSAYNITGEGGEVHMPYLGNSSFTEELGFRLYLSSDAKPGTYQWPLSFMITAM